MIRRWSHINNLNSNLLAFKIFDRRLKICNFKDSVLFKRFTFKITKFKRHSHTRFKHRMMWVIYTNVFKLWSKDYFFTKHYSKNQFLNKSAPYNFFFYNFNFVKNKETILLSNFSFYFSIWSKKSISYFFNISSNSFKYTSSTFAWCTSSPILTDSPVPLYSEWEGALYAINSKKKSVSFEMANIFDSIFVLILKKHIEVRKIISLLFFFNTLKFRNVK